MSKGLDEVLEPAYAELALRVEADLADHVAELNERRRNLLTLRGLGVTSVSALLSATVVSNEGVLALFAALVICAVVYSDLDANRHIEAIEKRLPFLEGMVLDVRRCLARGARDPRIVESLKTDLHRYKRTPPGTDEVPWGVVLRSPVLRWKPQWPVVSAPGSLGVRQAFGGFIGFYVLLAVGCVVLGLSVLLASSKITEVVSCQVAPGSDLGAAANHGRCTPVRPVIAKGSHCRIPRALRRDRLVAQCYGVQGAVAISIVNQRQLVLSQVAAVGPDGTVAVSVKRLRRGETYRVTITDEAGQLARSDSVSVR